MKKLIITALMLSLMQMTFAQINALTETGDEVILYEDGTWKYLVESVMLNSEVFVNDKEFLKDAQSTFLVRSSKLNIGMWIDPKAWKFSKGTDNDAFEYQFEKKGDDLYAMLISEKVQIQVESLKEIALNNARAVAPDMRIIHEEYRIVNGLRVFMMQMSGTIQGMKITYCGYYYSNPNGTIQFLTYTGDNLFRDYLVEIEKFLNGLVEI